MNTKSKYWTFTVNNYTADEEQELKNLFLTGKATYLVYGKEVGGRERTPHLQGYVELHDRKRGRTVKQFGGLQRAHLECRRGSAIQAAAYCKKDEVYVELGTISKVEPGKRTDLNRALDAIKEGASYHTLWQEYPAVMVRYGRSMREAIARLGPRDTSPRYGIESFVEKPAIETGTSTVLVGAPGLGKTQYVKALFPRALWVTHMDDLTRYDPELYDGIIFDDMSFNHMPRCAQIHVCDTEEDRSIHCRYTTARIPAGTTKVFTTNDWGLFGDDAAIRRRLTVVEVTNKLY